MKFPTDLKYTQEHEWVRVEDNLATVGITEYAQHQLGDIVYVELPAVGAVVQFMQPFGVVESVKAASDLFSPVSGTVAKVNSSLEDSPELVNTAPYSDGWMIVVKLGDLTELDQLLLPDDYSKFVTGLES
jgi:glycine cleavage system H protein